MRKIQLSENVYAVIYENGACTVVAYGNVVFLTSNEFESLIANAAE